MNNRIALWLAAVVFSFVGYACSMQQVTQGAGAASALLVLEDRYEAAVVVLESNLDRFPAETQASLRNLKRDTDDFVADLKRIWDERDTVALSEIDLLYEHGQGLYHRGVKLVGPYIRDMTSQEMLQLRRFSESAGRVGEAYNALSDNPDAEEKLRLVKAGMDFAALTMHLTEIL